MTAIFDAIAKSYDSWYQSKMGSFVDRVETNLAFRMFTVEKGMRVLDVGCGTGNFSIKLAGMGCKVTGIDVSEEMLAIAGDKIEKSSLDIQVRKMDVYKLDFPDGYFDAVFSMAAFEFVTEPQKALNEMFRVTKKGGRILVGTISGNSSWGKLYMTEEFRRNTVFKYADFKTLDEMKSWKPEHLVDAGECLFIPPDLREEEINQQKEQELSAKERGGYICALWKK